MRAKGCTRNLGPNRAVVSVTENRDYTHESGRSADLDAKPLFLRVLRHTPAETRSRRHATTSSHFSYIFTASPREDDDDDEGLILILWISPLISPNLTVNPVLQPVPSHPGEGLSLRRNRKSRNLRSPSGFGNVR